MEYIPIDEEEPQHIWASEEEDMIPKISARGCRNLEAAKLLEVTACRHRILIPLPRPPVFSKVTDS